jgi:hypothetical protein
MVDLSTDWQCSQAECKMQQQQQQQQGEMRRSARSAAVTPVKFKLQQQQDEVDMSAGAAGSAAVTPTKLKLEQQQQQHAPAAAITFAALTPAVLKLELQQQQAAAGGAIFTAVVPKLQQQQHALAAAISPAAVTPVQLKLEKQGAAACNAAAAAAVAAAFITPVKPKLEQQQQQHEMAGNTPAGPGVTAVEPPVMVKQELHHVVPAPPSALQLAAAATAAAAAAAVHHSPGATHAPRKVLGRDMGYAESGGFPFWRIASGNIYDMDNQMLPASVRISSAPGVSSSSIIGLGAAAGQQQQLPAGMSPLRPGLTSSSRAPSYGGAAAGSSSVRPVLPQWREAAWARSYCFKSPAWAAAGFKPVVLRQPFRQVRAAHKMHTQ